MSYESRAPNGSSIHQVTIRDETNINDQTRTCRLQTADQNQNSNLKSVCNVHVYHEMKIYVLMNSKIEMASMFNVCLHTDYPGYRCFAR